VPPAELAALGAAFARHMPPGAALEQHLAGVLRDTLAHPGSLIRAQLAWAILRGSDRPADQAESVAIAIEYFHTASLLFDDLPCMDDAEHRRGHPCPHLLHGEAAAILGALGFVNRAYALLWQALEAATAERRRQAGDWVEECLGVTGILDGQARDLHFADSAGRPAEVLTVAVGKTGTLLRLTLGLPALLGGASAGSLEQLRRLAALWGESYQMLDDAKDLFATRQESGKTPCRDVALQRPNYVLAAGIERTLAHLELNAQAAAALLAELGPDEPRWRVLAGVQQYLDQQFARLRPYAAEALCPPAPALSQPLAPLPAPRHRLPPIPFRPHPLAAP
jgi:geranylgeranyl pyrophosphate synthase